MCLAQSAHHLRAKVSSRSTEPSVDMPKPLTHRFTFSPSAALTRSSHFR